MANAAKALPTARDLALLQVIEDARAAAGLTQDDLAAAAGVSQPQMSRILSGVRPVTLPELLAMCSRLGLSLADVATAAGEA